MTLVPQTSGPDTGVPPVCWRPGTEAPAFDPAGVTAHTARVREPLYVVRGPAGHGTATGGSLGTGGGHPLVGLLPPVYPEWLGDRGFAEAHGTRFPYVAGEMAGGIATTRMVTALAGARLLGFFGAAGLSPDRVERAVTELTAALGTAPNWGVNLIHSPAEPRTEWQVADLLLRHRVRRISASAYLDLTPAVVRCAAAGLRQDADGRVVRDTHVFAKVSRREVAEKFMSPAPGPLLDALVRDGWLTAEQGRLARRVPVAEDITVEADSGGHTDNRPLTVVLPELLALRDRLAVSYGYRRPVRVGAAGGLGTPAAVAAAFALGAAYVMTGSVNQLAVESGVSADARELLAAAGVTDVTMAPAADMFEQGVRVQVLTRNTLFAARSRRLYDTYRRYGSLAEIPAELRQRLEREVFGAGLDEIWADTERFWQRRDPDQLTRAARDPRHRMALVFRWYVGNASRWAIEGRPERRADYQLWAGPALGAFNDWARGSVLADPARCSVTQIALNLLEGAAVLTRAHQLRTHGVPVPDAALTFRPRELV
ncbi:PfaD family polyunsaturated fatty acid/polyketide biosynthesis protein [Streptomyces sp. CRN 30]|uniref:PfaD family polyunsaturated fatty acid/polyketide biosynthesis protein n=1 Tax=Streptomyces sp. CRN 30 TaxID=3075613 RepID=UPI002A838FCE|nr:PfaD family polyunsaturated fatty acid/polyketide biosynthesis protein [Streptomyces sp. CRN 30]